jgi:serine/threonine protein kinase
LKLLDGQNATSLKRKRFYNEIAFCQRAQHPAVVRVVDHGIFRAKAGGKSSPFYVMPAYDGSLRKLFDAGLPNDKVLPFKT